MTKAPPRYKQASLIKELERHGIGRPATYAAILKNILDRGYISEDGKRNLAALAAGEALVDHLLGKADFFDLAYTAALEGDLNGIAEGKTGYRTVLSGMYSKLNADLAVI